MALSAEEVEAVRAIDDTAWRLGGNHFTDSYMNNVEKFPQPRYSLKKEDIIPLSVLPDSLSERKRSLGWPVELQGTGRTKEGTHEFEVRYPAGDVFLSFGVTLHELGHLRQEEFNPEIDRFDRQREYGAYLEAKEKDAYRRGLDRAKKFFPEVLEEVERKFQEFRDRGKLGDFCSFETFYEVLQGSIAINRALESVPEMPNGEEQDRLEYEALREAGVAEFFGEIEKARVEEQIDRAWIEDFIMKMVEKIADEGG